VPTSFDTLLPFMSKRRPGRNRASHGMFEYYALLWLSFDTPIFPIVLFVKGGGREGIAARTYRHEVLGREVMKFQYASVALARIDGREYLEKGPVAAALAPFMLWEGEPDELLVRVDAVDRVASSGLDEEALFLLINLIQTYSPVPEESRERYRQLVSRKEYRKVQELELTWADRLRKEGRDEGLQAGLLQGKRQTLKRLIVAKFGGLSKGVEARIDALDLGGGARPQPGSRAHGELDEGSGSRGLTSRSRCGDGASPRGCCHLFALRRGRRRKFLVSALRLRSLLRGNRALHGLQYPVERVGESVTNALQDLSPGSMASRIVHDEASHPQPLFGEISNAQLRVASVIEDDGLYSALKIDLEGGISHLEMNGAVGVGRLHPDAAVLAISEHPELLEQGAFDGKSFESHWIPLSVLRGWILFRSSSRIH